MHIEVVSYEKKYNSGAAKIWNRVVTDAVAFPQEKPFTDEEAHAFFTSQDYTGVAVDGETDAPLGVYILHPNNIGRCGHICNTSYAVDAEARGRGVGEALVRDSIEKSRSAGYRIIQLNAVVAFNQAALALYEKVGFVRMTAIPGGFQLADGSYVDIYPHYYLL